ncbi:MAG: hypothetical protein AAGF28_13265 [Pseudomonadota bacterium]
MPTIAVLPLVVRKSEDASIWGDMLTEDLIAAPSRSRQINVASFLPTISMSTEKYAIAPISKSLEADFCFLAPMLLPMVGMCWSLI